MNDARKNVPTSTRTTCVEIMYRDQSSSGHSRSRSFHAPLGAVRHPHTFVERADRPINANANTRYAGTSDIATTAGRRIHGLGTHSMLHDQKVKAGSTERPNTSVSTTKIETTVHTTRPVCAAVTARRVA